RSGVRDRGDAHRGGVPGCRDDGRRRVRRTVGDGRLRRSREGEMSAGAVPGRASRARHGLEVLGPADLAEVTEFLDAQPDVDVFVASRVEASGLEPRRLGGQLWGYWRAGELTGLCYSGANLVPVRAD